MAAALPEFALGVPEVYTVGQDFCLALAVALALWVRPWDFSDGTEAPERDANDQQSSSPSLGLVFLPVWFLCVAGDWLQGPYVYALYQAYGLARADIALLFVAGFGASMAFGTVVGSWVDSLGRKRGCQLYCVLYIVSCTTKHFNNFWILLCGRLTGGIATSLLFSAFEAWLIREHELRQKEGSGELVQTQGASQPESLRKLFGLMWFGSSVVAIVAGQVGDLAVGVQPLSPVGVGDLYFGGLTAAFDCAIVVLLFGLTLMSATWRENRGGGAPERGQEDGGAEASRSPLDLLSEALGAVWRSPALLALGAVVAGFEASMYAFVFNWTPSLTDGAALPPDLGSVFSTLMLAYMSGSLVFQLFGGRTDGQDGSQVLTALPPLRWALVLAPLALLVPALSLQSLPAGGVERTALVLAGFVAFEFCCGLYMPAVSAVKGALVPEGLRSSVYATYRVPMNGMVLVVLLSDFPPDSTLLGCVGLLALAAAAGAMLPSSSAPPPPPSVAGEGAAAAP